MARRHASPSIGTPGPGRDRSSGDRSGRALLSQDALRHLRDAILRGTLGPGDPLVEERLSAELGMSRVPIREAIRALLAEGLAQPGPHGRGARVAAAGPQLAADLIEVRAVLEALNARLAARRRDPAALGALRALLDRGEALAAQGGHGTELAQLNARFHDLLEHLGANRALLEMMRPLRERTEMLFRRNSSGRAREDWREHARILEAVAEGDEALAALLAERHVRRAAQAAAGQVTPADAEGAAVLPGAEAPPG